MVFLIITDNEFYDADCVLSIEGQTNTRMSQLGSLPPLPTEVSSDKQTLNMSSFFFLLGGRGINVSCIDFPTYPEINVYNALFTVLTQLLINVSRFSRADLNMEPLS